MREPEDLLHDHLTIGLVEDCPACEQLEVDFCWLQLHDPEDRYCHVCNCGCEADGEWHWDGAGCQCVNQGCPCVVDTRKQYRELAR